MFQDYVHIANISHQNTSLRCEFTAVYCNGPGKSLRLFWSHDLTRILEVFNSAKVLVCWYWRAQRFRLFFTAAKTKQQHNIEAAYYSAECDQASRSSKHTHWSEYSCTVFSLSLSHTHSVVRHLETAFTRDSVHTAVCVRACLQICLEGIPIIWWPFV